MTEVRPLGNGSLLGEYRNLYLLGSSRVSGTFASMTVSRGGYGNWECCSRLSTWDPVSGAPEESSVSGLAAGRGGQRGSFASLTG